LHGVVAAYEGTPCLGPDVLGACAATCDREGIAWSYSKEDCCRTFLMHRCQQAENDFCVWGGPLPQMLRKRWLRAASCEACAGPLLCPPVWGSLRRALILNDSRIASPEYLKNAMAICHGAGCAASFLTLSDTDASALRWQELAIQAVAGHEIEADFHTVVGHNAHSSVALVAGWCRCSHIIVDKASFVGWRRWFPLAFRNVVSELVDRFAILPVPAGQSPLAERLLETSATRRKAPANGKTNSN
jgi:hypothetical protein